MSLATHDLRKVADGAAAECYDLLLPVISDYYL